MTEDPPAPVESRTCGNCACLAIIERPKVQPLGMDTREFDAMPPRQAVCRLNPPLVIQTPKGRALMQMPTGENMVCWHWKVLGTLPGNSGRD